MKKKRLNQDIIKRHIDPFYFNLRHIKSVFIYSSFGVWPRSLFPGQASAIGVPGFSFPNPSSVNSSFYYFKLDH